FLLNVGGREVYRRAPARPVVAAVGNCSRDAVPALFHRRVWKSDNDDNRIAASPVHFDFYFVSIDAVNRSGVNFRQHRSGRAAENRCAEKRQISLQSETRRMSKSIVKYQGMCPRTSYVLASKTSTEKIEREASNGCHKFEYLTLLNTSRDGTTRDR